MGRRSTPARSALALLGLAGTLLAPAPARSGPVVEYLYVEANEGGSSGGHVALRLGEQVFHFQHQPPGIVALSRASYGRFRHQYADLENRSIHVTRIPAGDEAHARLADRFTRRHVVQDQQVAALHALARDHTTLETMLEGRISVEGTGLFFADGAAGHWRPVEEGGADAERADPGPADPWILALRRRIDMVRGPRFVAERLAQARARIAALDPEALDLPAETLSEGRVPAPTYGFVQRYADVAAGLVALEVLQSARAAERDALIDSDLGGELALEVGEAEAVRALAKSLEDSLVSLMASERPDWGPALLLGMARLVALRRAEEAGRWVVIDALRPRGSASWKPSERPDVAAAEWADAREELAALRRYLVNASTAADSFPELEMGAVEAAVGRLVEVRRAIADDRPLRHLRADLPARPAHVSLPWPVPADRLRRGLAQVKAREQTYAGELVRLYGYNVVTRNCVTEILHEMDAALERTGSAREWTRGLAFIPAVSSGAVRDLYASEDTVEIPSYRKRELARMRASESGAAVYWRESNTLTSTLYRRDPRDSVFLFFTDDVVAARPLLGAANALVGLGATAAGLATFPSDGGAMLRSGLRGILWSLPKLVFQNVRKGSFDHARPPE